MTSRVPPGTSPLTRGKCSISMNWTLVDGNIPAHAGKIHQRWFVPTNPTEHPRSRGENTGVEVEALKARGTSPLTRGKSRSRALLRACPGNIPAHAGKMHENIAHGRTQKEHPRSRGENSHGSGVRSSSLWNIPAHAGKMLAVSRRMS